MRAGKSSTRNALRFSLLGVAMLAMIQQGTMAKAAPLDPTGILPSPVAGSTILARLAESDATTKARVVEAYGKLPLSFEANRGQTDDQVRYLARGPGYTFFLTPTEAVMALNGRQPASSDESQQTGEPGRSVVRMKLVRGNADPQITGSDPLPGKSNYFIGKDPKNWRTNIPHFHKVHYREVYPGIDLVFYGNPRQLQYDFTIAPGADPETITLAFEGADRLEIDAQGNLILHIPGGQVIQHPPIIYQDVKGTRHPVDGQFVLREKQAVGFHVAKYDSTRPLVIDPVLVYSSFLGGGGIDRALSVAVDFAGNAYVTGSTESAIFPTTVGAFQTVLANPGFTDAFVSKVNPAGDMLLYSSYLGGSNSEIGNGIAVDGSGAVYLIGSTASTDFPTTVGAFQTALANAAGVTDAFVTKLNPAGGGAADLVYSTYLGGSESDIGRGIAVDGTVPPNIYVTGETPSTDFPTTVGAFQTTLADDPAVVTDAFVTKLNPAGGGAADLVYSTYLGGDGADIGNSIVLDTARNAYVTGSTASDDFPTTAGVFQTALANAAGVTDAFVTKLNTDGTDLVYSTYLGGSQSDAGRGIAVDAVPNAYVTGETPSTNFPTTMGAFQTALADAPAVVTDAFVSKLNDTGTALVYSTFLGGVGADIGNDIALDGVGNAYVTGSTVSANFPTAGSPFQAALAGPQDAFVTKLNATGTALVYSTYLGGGAEDIGHGIALDPFDDAYVVGETNSANFPTASFQSVFGGVTDAFISKIDESTAPPPPPSNGASSGCFIATAAFGSPLAPQVQVLREFRDRHLLTNAPGRLVTTAYYRISPPLAEVVARSKPLRSVVRAGLTPVIGWTELFMWSPALGFAISLAFLGLGSRVALAAARRYRSRK